MNEIRQKIERLKQGGRPRVVDLFSGCGGISLGFHSAGFQLIANVELDEFAAATHAHNFHGHEGPEREALFAKPRDITKIEPEELLSELYPGQESATLVDVVVGGPPCQAFARVGRAKLREVASHPEAYKVDPRGNLYLRYLHYVERMKPLALLMENVPDVLNYGGHNIPHEMSEYLQGLGYVCRYTLLNAVHYGVPELRERFFLIAVRKELGVIPVFPQPTYWMQVPHGYVSARRVAMQGLNDDQGVNFVAPPEPHDGLRRFVSAQEATGDLPEITLHLEGRLRRGARRFTELLEYPEPVEEGTYAHRMRNWPNFTSTQGVRDHVIRYLPRDWEIFRRMNAGDQYPEAYRVAVSLFEEKLAEARETEEIPEGSDRYKELWAQYVPPYDPGKFPNKWRKMEADLPARTLMAHLGKDGYSHIHYDSAQARTISVREAARLQSFPDGFTFKGTMNPAFRQIGNAVPPLLSTALAETLMETIRAGISKTDAPAPAAPEAEARVDKMTEVPA